VDNCYLWGGGRRRINGGGGMRLQRRLVNVSGGMRLIMCALNASHLANVHNNSLNDGLPSLQFG